MRLFVGIEIPPETQLELERRVLRARSVLASELLPSGARYRTVETYPLGGAS